MKPLYYTIATGFGVGYSPIAPGTAGSILALVLAFFLFRGDALYLIIATIVLAGAGIMSASFMEKERKIKDPQLVVVDEMVGMWISLLLVPCLWWSYLIAFVFFRLFDVVKPFPVNSVQNIHGGIGIMLDDVIAGIYALICTHLILHFT
jgi:phosphatidylglycerophosphatase A